MNKPTRLLLHEPAFCVDPECTALIRKGRAKRIPQGLVHPWCEERLRHFSNLELAAPEPVMVAYDCKMPKKPELYRLENLDSIRPLEGIAASLEPEQAGRMYSSLSKLYVDIVIARSSDISPSTFEYIAAPFSPMEECMILEKVRLCANLSCEQPIYDGQAVLAENGAIYHNRCPEQARFEFGMDPGVLTEINVRYSCAKPNDTYLELLLANTDIAALYELFSPLGVLARDAFLAVQNLMKKAGISGYDLMMLSRKYKRE